MAHVLVVYRVLVTALFSNLPILGEQVTTAVVVTGALVHYVTILIMTKVGAWAGEGGEDPAEAPVSLPVSPPAGQQVGGTEALQLW